MSQQINLFNPELIPPKEWLDARFMAVAVVSVLLLMLASYGYARHQFQQLARQAEAVSQDLQASSATLAEVSAKFGPRKPSEALAEEIVAAEQRLKTHQAVLDVLQQGAPGQAASMSEYMRSFARQRVSGLWLTGVQIEAEGAHLTISGRALEPDLVPQYIALLRAEPALQGKTFSAMGITQGKVDQPKPSAAASSKDAASATAASVLPSYIEFRLESANSSAIGAGGKS